MGYLFVIAIGCGLLVASTGFAIWRGGPAERMTGIFMLAAWLGAYALQISLSGIVPKSTWELTLLAIDAAEAIALLVLAIRYAKLWLGIAMLMQSAALALHGVAMADWGFRYVQYLKFNNLVSFANLVLLAFATALAWRDRQRAAARLLADNADGRPGWAAPNMPKPLSQA